MNCDGCGKRVEEDGSSLIGISLTFDPKVFDEFSLEFCQRQLGKYVLGKTYNFCWECWLKSLGAKPPIEEKVEA